jgi:hypothetical protein
MMERWRSSHEREGELLRHQVLDTVLEVKGTSHSRPTNGQNCTLPKRLRCCANPLLEFLRSDQL